MGAAELHTGQHHILYLTREFSSESYKRFYYDEILAIVSVKTAEFSMVNAISLTVALLSLFALLGSLDELTLAIFCAIFLIAGLLAFISNLIKGPTVRTVIQTGVNREEIACLRRQRACDKALPRLRELIQQAQADMVPKAETEPVTTSSEPPPDDTEPQVELENA